MKIKFNACRPEDYRYLTEVKQKDMELAITVQYGSNLINATFKETTKIEDVKLQLFRQMLAHNRNNLSQLLNLVTF